MGTSVSCVHTPRGLPVRGVTCLCLESSGSGNGGLRPRSVSVSLVARVSRSCRLSPGTGVGLLVANSRVGTSVGSTEGSGGRPISAILVLKAEIPAVSVISYAVLVNASNSVGTEVTRTSV